MGPWGDRSDSPVGDVLPYKQEEVVLDAQIPHEKLGTVVIACTLYPGWAGETDSLGFTDQPVYPNW